MTEFMFDEFLESALDELSDKHDALELEFGIGNYARFLLNQGTERLEFFDADDRKILSAEFIDIGSYAPPLGTWHWAWANSSVLASLREKAEVLQSLTAETGVDWFSREAPFPIEDERRAWELTAASIRKLGALGAYRVPNLTKSLLTFVALTRIHKLDPS